MFFEMNLGGGGTSIDVSNPDYYSTGSISVSANGTYTVNCGCRAKYVLATCRSGSTSTSQFGWVFCDAENQKSVSLWGSDNQCYPHDDTISDVTDTSFVFKNPFGAQEYYKFLVYA